MPPPVAVQRPPKRALVTVSALALRTSTVNVEFEQFDVTPPKNARLDVNPMSGEWSVCSVPTKPQLAAEDSAGITNAHTAIAPPKSKTPFLEKFFMTNTPL
jgi:hypothetical protein